MLSRKRASGSGQGGAKNEPPKKRKAVDEYKIFNDSVHGHIKMDSVLLEIIDTPEFQRLRNIKQLGGGYYVFPGASHNCFEHSIGVAHLAGQLVESLRETLTKENVMKETLTKETLKKENLIKENLRKETSMTETLIKKNLRKETSMKEILMKETSTTKTSIKENLRKETSIKEILTKKTLMKGVEITDKDKLCVQIAALCHDLGHGPFSHLFEDFMKNKPKIIGTRNRKAQEEWKHAEQSIRMFERLWRDKSNILQKKIYGICKEELKDEDLQFIRELIYVPKPPTYPKESESEWPYKGRPKEKSFLYEIINNKTTGIDVDKMDSFSRDCLHLGMKNNFSHEQFVMFARVCFNEEEHKYQICMRDKEALNMYEIFHSRYLLHNNYQHGVKISNETMIVDALLEADKYFKLENNLRISEAVKTENLEVYLKLTDNILQDIKRSSNPKLKHAKKIIERIETRDLYKFVGGDKLDPKTVKGFDTDKEWKNIVKKWLRDLPKGLQDNVNIKNIRVIRAKLNYGRDEDPIQNLRFYRKGDEDKAVKLEKKEISHLLPEKFSEIKVMMFYTGPKTFYQGKEIHTALKEHLDKFWRRVNPCPTCQKN